MLEKLKILMDCGPFTVTLTGALAGEFEKKAVSADPGTPGDQFPAVVQSPLVAVQVPFAPSADPLHAANAKHEPKTTAKPRELLRLAETRGNDER